MAIVQDLLDRFRTLETEKAPWTAHHHDIATYGLPDAERFDAAFARFDTNVGGSIVSSPIAAERGKAIYDMTSLAAIDRGAAGTLSLITPQASIWHDVATADPFGGEPTDAEKRWHERLRDYLFAVRGNPRSGFWTAHKAAMRCVWAFGTAIVFVEESNRGASSPLSYRFVPLSECHLGTNFEGVVDTNFRLFKRSARQCVERWGNACSQKVQDMAKHEKDKDKAITLLHAVYPRAERGSQSSYGRDMKWASCYLEVEQKHLIGEGGFADFPYRVDHWQRNNPGPYAEGPIALALADIKSLNAMAKAELRATQQWTDPPTATPHELSRVNLNPRANNPGYLTGNGDLLIKPIITAQRPDFASAVMETRRKGLRSTLYIDVWTTIIDSPRQMTAYEVMIKANEKGELLGPVGSSLQTGLSFQFEREVGVLARMGAFDPGSPIEPPESLRGREVAVRFTSPLDKLRRIPQLQGMSQWLGLVATAAQIKPEAADKVDVDEMLDVAADILDVPAKVQTPSEVLERIRDERLVQQNTEAGIAATQGAGEAATAAAEGATAVAQSPAASAILQRLAGLTGGMGAPAQ